MEKATKWLWTPMALLGVAIMLAAITCFVTARPNIGIPIGIILFILSVILILIAYLRRDKVVADNNKTTTIVEDSQVAKTSGNNSPITQIVTKSLTNEERQKIQDEIINIQKQEPISGRINYLLSNTPIIARIFFFAVSYLHTKTLDDAKISYKNLNRNAKYYICNILNENFAKSCYILICAAKNSHKKMYDKLFQTTKLVLENTIIENNLPNNIQIIPEIIENENQIREALKIVEDNLIQGNFLKE